METKPLTDWLYQRFVEKEDLLAHFYQTGLCSPHCFFRFLSLTLSGLFHSEFYHSLSGLSFNSLFLTYLFLSLSALSLPITIFSS